MQQFGFEKGRACLFFSSPNNQRKQTGPELIKPGFTLVSLTDWIVWKYAGGSSEIEKKKIPLLSHPRVHIYHTYMGIMCLEH